jgi:hypothetical protein
MADFIHVGPTGPMPPDYLLADLGGGHAVCEQANEPARTWTRRWPSPPVPSLADALAFATLPVPPPGVFADLTMPKLRLQLAAEHDGGNTANFFSSGLGPSVGICSLSVLLEGLRRR